MENSPIRILQIVPNMQAGGLETLIMNLYRSVDRSKIQFDFLVHYKEECFYDKEIYELGGKIYHLTIRNDNNLMKYLFDLKAFFGKHPEYDIVHTHMVSTAVFCLFYAKRYNVTLRIIHSHNTNTIPGIKGFLKKILAKTAPLFANSYFACGKLAGTALFKNKEYVIIKNGVDITKFKFNQVIRNEMRQNLQIENKKVFGHVGRFNIQKNHEFLLKVFSEIYKLNNDSILLLIGDGELKNKVLAIAQSLNIMNNVKYLGIRDDVNKLYQAMDAFILPSFFEGFPVVATECQAAGLPMLVSDNISSEIKITPLIEFLSLNDSVDKWANKALEISNIERIDYSKEVIDKGYDIKNVAEKLMDIYMDIYK